MLIEFTCASHVFVYTAVITNVKVILFFVATFT